MDDQRNDVNYLPVPVHEHLSTEARLEKMTKSYDVKIDLFNNGENGKRYFLYMAVCAANLTAVACGVAVGWTSPAIPKLNGEIEPDNNPLPKPITPQQASWIGSLLPLGAVFGPFVAGLFIDRIGRKKSLLISVIPFIVAFYMAIFISDLNIFYLMRFLCGLACGAIFTILPIYVAEISENSIRGALGSLFVLFITIGVLLSYSVGPYISLTMFNIVCSIPPSLFFPIFLIFIPDSPHYLIAKGEKTKAENALMKFRQRTRQSVQKELLEIKESVESSMSNKGSFLDLFKLKGLVRALLLSLALMTFQQLSGINIILFYTQNIFAQTGTSIPDEISAIIVGVVQVLSTVLTPLFVDRTGKRAFLMFSAIGMAVFHGTLGCYFYFQNYKLTNEYFFWLPIASVVCYNITYSVGFGPLPWAILGEIFPPNMKSAASTIIASFCWLLAFIITNVFGTVTDLIGISGAFWMFSFSCVLAFIFVYFQLPETSGKSLQEIQNMLNSS